MYLSPAFETFTIFISSNLTKLLRIIYEIEVPIFENTISQENVHVVTMVLTALSQNSILYNYVNLYRFGELTYRVLI